MYSGTGVAVYMPDGSSTLYSYYQDPDGSIIENRLEGRAWSIQGSDYFDGAVVAHDAQQGSPLAAISWNLGNNLYVRVKLLVLDYLS